MRRWNILLSTILVVVALLGLLVLSGGARFIAAPKLEARLVVQDYPVPAGFGIDPNRVAGFMAEKLQQRVDDDIAMRLSLKPDELRKVKEIVLPRLMNVVVVQAMMKEIPELSAILELGDVQLTVSGQVMTSEDLEDVALTIPGALLAEVNGEKLQVTTTSTGMTALALGNMAAGQKHSVTIWLGDEALNQDLGRTIRIGAAKGERGRVLLWGSQGWFGADLEALRWSRWLIGAILGGVLIFGLSSLLLPVLTSQQAKSRRGR